MSARTFRASPTLAARRTGEALALLGALGAFALGVAAPRSAFAQEQGAPAQQRFLSGRRHLDARHYPEALEDFRASLALFPSPNTRLYLARTLREAGREGEAYREFVRTADEAEARARTEPRYGPTGSAARAEAQALLPRIATLTLVLDDAPREAVVRVNGEPIERSQWGVTLATDPGSVAIEAEAPGRAAFRTNVELAAGHAARVQVLLAPLLVVGTGEGFVTPGAGAGAGAAPNAGAGAAATPGAGAGSGNQVVVVGSSGTGPGPGAGIAIMISGGALVLGGSIAGAFALSTYLALDGECMPSGGRCTVMPADAASRADGGRTAGGLFTAGLVLGSAALITGGVIFAVTGGGNRERASNTGASYARWAFFVDPARDGLALRVRGAF